MWSRRVTLRMIGVVCLGSVVGLAGGVAFGRFVEALLFEVKPTDIASLAVPLVVAHGRGGARGAARRPFARCGSIRRKRSGPIETVGLTRRG